MPNFYDSYGDKINVYDKDGNQIKNRDQTKALGTVDVKALMDAGLSMAEIKQVDSKDILYSIVPEGCSLESKDLSKTIEGIEDRRKERETGKPLRNTGDVKIADVESFVYMVDRERIPASTIVQADMNNRKFTGIINFAESGEVGGFGDRTISLSLVYTLEFERWLKENRERMTQLQLADFLEENLENITEPSAAEMVEMISNLKIKRNAQYHSVVDTATGEQSLTFSEKIKGETVNGNFEFRSKFTITIIPYIGSNPYAIECNLRFSVEDERLRIFFTMINIAKIEEHAFDAENSKVREAMEGLDVPVINIR